MSALIQAAHLMDSAIMLARAQAAARGASPVEVERNVQKYTSDDPVDCLGRLGFKQERVYRNPNWTKRHYECTNVVACVAPAGVRIEKYVPASPDVLEGLTHLWTEAGVRYFGYL